MFFDAAFVILVNLVKSLSRKGKIPFVSLVTALSVGLIVTHAMVIPTPGPIAVAGTMGVKEARAGGFDIVMYGHTHRPFYEVDKKDGDKDLIVLNPGSLSYPRQDGHRPSYMLMDIDRDGEAHFSLNYLER